jgi:hypothetical protein
VKRFSMQSDNAVAGTAGPIGAYLLPHYADEEQLAATMESMLLGTPEGQAAL